MFLGGQNMKIDIGLITENSIVISEYINQVKYIFGDTININTYSIEDGSAFVKKKENIFLVSANSSEYFEDVRKTLSKGDVVIPVYLSFFRRNLLLLNAYPKGTRALLVNVTKRMAEETITSLHQTGTNNIEFVPYYPGCPYKGDIKLAVTVGHEDIVPDFIEDIVDIGWRQISTLTMAELAIKIDCEYILETKRFLELSEKLFDLSDGFSTILTKYKVLRKEFDTLLQTMDVGIIATDSNHHIYACNHQAALYLGIKRTDLLSNNVTSFIDENLYERCRLQQVINKTQMIGFKKETIDISITPVIRGSQFLGAITIISVSETSEINDSMDFKSVSKGHVTRYNFSDIIGNSETIRQTIKLAKMMAKTDSSVLITGESGTGKELFAHSIHNNSKRSQGPFVAINCAAENLLESELFGYEGGSFTGAKKGGKIGLFEIAVNGTLFLDEIEGMSQNLQVKLLRVIQEREIMRVGGDTRIPIDVRIISASNQELLPLTSGGSFRSDLFYRLSTLPIELPPLRKRRSDIPILIEEFKNILNASFVLTEETKNILYKYDWPGNIRELHNCVEYFGCLNLPVIEPDNLPFYIQRFAKQNQALGDATDDIISKILDILHSKPCGRSTLLEELKIRGILISESKLRSYLTKLKDNGWISTKGGRGGSFLTDLGKSEIINRYK